MNLLHALQPMRPQFAIIMVLVLALCSFGLTWTSLGQWLPPNWQVTDARLRENLFPIAAPVTIFSALVTSTFNVRSVVWSPLSFRGAALTTKLGLSLAGLAALGFTLGNLPLLMSTAVGSTWGHLDYLMYLTNLVTLVVWVAFGMLCGVLMPRVIAMFVAPIGSYVLQGALTLLSVGRDDDLAVVLPTWASSAPVLGHVVPITVHVVRLALFAVVALGLFAIVQARATKAGTPGTRTWFGWSFAVLLAPALVIGLILGVRPATVQTAIPANAACELATTTPELKVCLHPAQSKVLPDAVAAAREVDQLLPVGTLRGSLNGTGVAPPTDSDLSIGGRPTRDFTYISMVETMVQSVTGATRCSALTLPYYQAADMPPANLARAAAISSVLSKEIQRRALKHFAVALPDTGAERLDSEAATSSLAAGANAFAGLDHNALKTWFAQHQAAIRSCTLTLEDLPH